MSDPPVVLERDGPVARLILNRPEAGNAIDLPLARAMMEAAITCDEDDAIRCVLPAGCSAPAATLLPSPARARACLPC
jgi:2-(1,2-epoxy-1,2-dihydrophenyl)acetyl-CoA isomerase